VRKADNRKKQKRKEAQTRQDFSEFAKIGEGDIGKQVISPQMYLATFQYLSTGESLIGNSYDNKHATDHDCFACYFEQQSSRSLENTFRRLFFVV
jgi:hypothetical protein